MSRSVTVLATGPQALVQDLEVNDISSQPWFFKRYPDDLPRTDLPRDHPKPARRPPGRRLPWWHGTRV